MFLPYKAVFFILLFFKNHRYSDNSNGFHNLFVKPATVCPHNPFGISIRIALEVPITLRRIYIFPIIESSHPGASCVSWFNQMLFKSFKRVTRFIQIYPLSTRWPLSPSSLSRNLHSGHTEFLADPRVPYVCAVTQLGFLLPLPASLSWFLLILQSLPSASLL